MTDEEWRREFDDALLDGRRRLMRRVAAERAFWRYTVPDLAYSEAFNAVLFERAAREVLVVPVARVAVSGDEESAVPQDTIDTLLDLARADRRDDFMVLAGAVGLSNAQRDELWTGTRRRLGKDG